MSAEESEEKRSPDLTKGAGKKREEEATDPNTLTPEEQLARYEESLKEDDWGHQPC